MIGIVPERINRHGNKIEDITDTGQHDSFGGQSSQYPRQPSRRRGSLALTPCRMWSDRKGLNSYAEGEGIYSND